MMSEVNIKVEVAGTVYPLKVNGEDEQNIREAVRLINNKIAEFERSYAIRDKKELMGMVMLQLVSELLKQSRGAETDLSNLRKLFTDVEGMLKNHQRNIDTLGD